MRTAGPSRALLFVTLVACASTMVWAAFGSRELRAAPDAREMQAREDFAAGRYQEALDLFAKLYAEKLHPNYLRNIGRCYQNLAEPDRAISSFREYLRKAKKMTQAERVEIEGYIAEMDQLKKSQEAARPAASRDGNAPSGTPPSPGAAAPTATATATAPAANLTVVLDRDAAGTKPAPRPAMEVSAAPAAPAPRQETSPVYARWWFWAIVGGVIAAGVGGAAAAGVFTTKTDAPCQTAVCR